MTSRRLPGKVLTEAGGRPILGHLLDRLRRAEPLDAIVVATSTDRTDDPVAEFCANEGVDVFRGPLDDVAGRLLAAAESADLETIVRVCADSPLLDHRIVTHGVRLSIATGADLVTNVFPRSYPLGQSVEVVATHALRRAWEAMHHAEDREHVTRYFYAHPDEFKIVNFDLDPRADDIRMVVDTPEDLARVGRILAAVTNPSREYDVDRLIALAREIDRTP